MTTIVYKDGVLASDTKAYSGGAQPLGCKKKIHQLPSGSFVAVSASQVGAPEAFIDFIKKNGEHMTVFKDGDFEASALLVTQDGKLYYYNCGLAFSGPIKCNYLAIGSGDRYAMGALECGLSAEESIVIASKIDAFTNDIVDTVKII